MAKPTINPTMYRIDGWTVYIIVTMYTPDDMRYEIINAIPDLLLAGGEYLSLDIIELETAIFTHLTLIDTEVH